MSQVNELIFYLKKAIRAQGTTYKELAAKLNVSESTLKRWFSKNSFSIERLDDICMALSMDLTDIIPSKRNRRRVGRLIEEQEWELAADDSLLAVFYLAISGTTAEAILSKFDINEARLRSLLIRLDHLELIELHPGDRIVPLVTQDVGWLPQGPLSQKYGSAIRHDFMETDFEGELEKYWLVSGNMSKASLQVFTRKLNALLDEFQGLIELDQDHEDNINITFFAAHRPWTLPMLKGKKKL